MQQAICIILIFFSTAVMADAPSLGIADFPTSGSPEAQPSFLQGVLWLHSFEYENAREAFREAQKIDPGFAMAYWGEAMTYDHPVWTEQDRSAARAALNRLAPDPEARQSMAKMQREKDYLAAVEILYGEGDKKDRDAAYSSAMRKLSEKYPDDLEAASFYALSLIGLCQGKRDFSLYMKAAALAEEVFAKNPRHPGAAHYLIHSYDDPVHAPLGLRAARAYAKIAPAATHALHMPSHIFLALGMWDHVVSSNLDSWEASKQTSYHAMHWLQYGYLQQGKFDHAKNLLMQIKKNVEGGSLYARRHLVMMRAGFIIETQKWTDDAVEIQVDTSDFVEDQSLVGTDLFVGGFARLKSGDIAAAEKVLESWEVPPAPGEGRTTYYDLETQMKSAEISKMQLEAAVLLARGRKDEALKRIEEAARNEDSMVFDFGPPVPVKPSRELWGEMLLEVGRPNDARAQFELALQRAPGRTLSLKGVATTEKK